RGIRSQLLQHLSTDGTKRAIAVVSPDSGDGKTYCAANLAIAFSQLGSRTLLVDADMRNPRLAALFDIEDKQVLSTMLCCRAPRTTVTSLPYLPHLYVLTVGRPRPNPLELIERPAF